MKSAHVSIFHFAMAQRSTKKAISGWTQDNQLAAIDAAERHPARHACL
jgi:hypothetical protein